MNEHSDKFTDMPEDETKGPQVNGSGQQNNSHDYHDTNGGLETGETKEPKLPPITFMGKIDFAAIPQTEFLYGKFFARGYMSLTVAAPKVGKSLLALIEAVDMATGGKVFGKEVDPRKVAYLNPEDDQGVLENRVAAICTHYGIHNDDIAETLAVQSLMDFPDFFLIAEGQAANTVQVNKTAVKHLWKRIKETGVDVVILDPLQDLSHADETNKAFRRLGQMIRAMANGLGVAFHVVHHTRKVQAGMPPTIDDSRGGSALRGASRFNRVLVAMSETEAKSAGEDDHRHFFRIGEIESNMAPPESLANKWYQKVGVECPNGEWVAVVKPWQWPDAFANVTTEQAGKIRQLIAEADPPARKNVQAKNWAGHIVLQVIGMTISDTDEKKEETRKRAIAGGLIKGWIKTGVLKVGEWTDEKGKKRPIIEAGENDPNEPV